MRWAVCIAFVYKFHTTILWTIVLVLQELYDEEAVISAIQGNRRLWTSQSKKKAPALCR
jgi:hypothetical protein